MVVRELDDIVNEHGTDTEKIAAVITSIHTVIYFYNLKAY